MKNVIIKTLITTFSSLMCFNGGNIPVNESHNEPHFNLNKDEELSKYSDVADDELSVKVSQNATTELTQYYSFSFTTVDNLFTTVRPDYKGISIAIKDAAYSGNYNDYPTDAPTKPVFEAEVYSIDGGAITNGIAIIPSDPYFQNRFEIKITSIRSNCLLFPNSIKTIFIPDSVEIIKDDSFAGIASDTTIECASQSEKSGWESGWNGGITPTYSAADRNSDISKAQRNFSSPATNNNGNKFFVGVYFETNQNPLKLIYDVEKNGTVETRIAEFSKHSINSDYDAVGNPLAQDSVDLGIVLQLNEGETVKDDSLIIANIFKAKIDSVDGIDKNVPDYSAPLKIKAANKCERFYLSSFITMKASSISKLGDYTRLEISVDTVPGIYEKVKPSIYNSYKKSIENGTCKIRYRYTSLSSASYRITYQVDNAIKVKDVLIKSPYTFYNLENDKDNRVGFLIKNSDVGDDFETDNIIKVDLMNFYMTVDVYNYDTKNIVSAQCSYNVKFGIANLYNKDVSEVKTYNLNLALRLVIILSVVLYACGAVGLYFLLSEKFKNDEFRRVNTKSFIKKAIIYFIGYVFIVASLTTIIFRWGYLNNSVVVYNPVDAFVIVFTIGALISIGLFIKELVVAIRVSAKRKKDKKLKIGETVEEDGTK